MDPISIIGTVAGVATAGVSLVTVLFETLETYRNAPREIGTIARGIQDLTLVLDHLVQVLSEGSDLHTRRLRKSVLGTVERIEDVQDEVWDLIERGDSSFGRVKWTLFLNRKMRDLVDRIEAHKSTVQLVCTTLLLAMQQRRVAKSKEPTVAVFARRRLRRQAENLVNAAHQSLRDLTGRSHHGGDVDGPDDDAALNPEDSEPVSPTATPTTSAPEDPAANSGQGHELIVKTEQESQEKAALFLYNTIFSRVGRAGGSPKQQDREDDQSNVLIIHNPRGKDVVLAQRPFASQVVDGLLRDWTFLSDADIEEAAKSEAPSSDSQEKPQASPRGDEEEPKTNDRKASDKAPRRADAHPDSPPKGGREAKDERSGSGAEPSKPSFRPVSYRKADEEYFVDGDQYDLCDDDSDGGATSKRSSRTSRPVPASRSPSPRSRSPPSKARMAAQRETQLAKSETPRKPQDQQGLMKVYFPSSLEVLPTKPPRKTALGNELSGACYTAVVRQWRGPRIALLSVNKEAREEALRFYRVHFPCRVPSSTPVYMTDPPGSGTIPTTFYFNPEWDCLYFDIKTVDTSTFRNKQCVYQDVATALAMLFDLRAYDPLGISPGNLAIDPKLLRLLANLLCQYDVPPGSQVIEFLADCVANSRIFWVSHTDPECFDMTAAENDPPSWSQVWWPKLLEQLGLRQDMLPTKPMPRWQQLREVRWRLEFYRQYEEEEKVRLKRKREWDEDEDGVNDEIG
ncbi:hypothetical protein B0T16DRAFT_463454 [Cercophora newfieldiana]|uniref:Fungal N-terminal domain-containing protein n=1 Tax=Cercophora newfieldiana TaxID=92897 RepID=A0AA40CIL8_9PEZI|nr:hypothetical protein B0T16DRAFT_463454 [Cercophora newfieldiana]